MPHRGRLNVLANTLDKPYGMIFGEFEDNHPETYAGDGDVKYHLGFSPTTSPPITTRSTSRSPPTPATSRPSTRWSKGG